MGRRHKSRAGVSIGVECGDRAAQWAESAAALLQVVLVPGDEFFITRDIFIYPEGYFLTSGIRGLCALAYCRLLARKPFISGLLLRMPGVSLDVARCVQQEASVRRETLYMLRRLEHYVQLRLDLDGGDHSRTGESQYNRLAALRRLPRLTPSS